jgi:hypothetical protein
MASTMAETGPSAAAAASSSSNPVSSPVADFEEEGDDALSSGSTRADDLEHALTGQGASELPPAMIESAVRTVFGRLTMAPTNWHQMAIFYLSSPHDEDAELRKHGPVMFAISLVLVLTQCFVIASIGLGAFFKSCGSNDDCDRGMFCVTGIFADRCNYCSSSPPILFYGSRAGTMSIDGLVIDGRTPVKPFDLPGWPDVYNFTLVAEICADPSGRQVYVQSTPPPGILDAPSSMVLNWCDACVSGATGHVDLSIESSVASRHIAAMGFADLLALTFASMIIGLAAVGEIKDIDLSRMAMDHAGDRLGTGWRRGFVFVNFLRRRVFILLVVMAATILVLFHGGDALSVCMNTVAILFIFEVDNAMFAVGTAERVRARVEAAGRVEIGDDEAAELARKKWLHVVGVTATVLVGVHTSVWASQQRKEPVFAGVWLTTSIACGVASVVEELWANGLWKDLSSPAAWRSIGLALVLSVLGANVAMLMSLIVFNSAS